MRKNYVAETKNKRIEVGNSFTPKVGRSKWGNQQLGHI